MLSWNDLIGRRLGQYEIVGELGRGGSSRVYRAYAHEDGRDVAMKVIPNDADDRAGFVQRFMREVEVIRKLNHPNIVQVYGSGQTNDIVYLVLQCVMGGTLRQRLGGRPLSVQQAAIYVIQMARALHHAHLQGIVHRDVKPSNMLVDADNPNHLLLTDFGTAKIQGARGPTKSGTTIGTPEYMSPEQAEGRDIDQRSDIYALGCVLYEALATRPPFVGSTPVSVLYQHVHSRPASIRSYNTSAPRELARIVEIALAKRPEDRFGTAEQLAEALTPFAEGGVQPAPAPWLQSPRPSAPYSGPLAPPPIMRAPKTAPIATPDTPPTLPSTGPLAPAPGIASTLRPMTPAAFAAIQTPPTLPSVAEGTFDQSIATPPTIFVHQGSRGAPEQSPSITPPGLPAWLATSMRDEPTPEKAASAAMEEKPQPLTGERDEDPEDVDEEDVGRAPGARRRPRQSIPLPAFRLPGKTTEPTGSRDDRDRIAEMMAQIEAGQHAHAGAPPEEAVGQQSIEQADRKIIESIPIRALDETDHGAVNAVHDETDTANGDDELDAEKIAVAQPQMSPVVPAARVGVRSGPLSSGRQPAVSASSGQIRARRPSSPVVSRPRSTSATRSRRPILLGAILIAIVAIGLLGGLALNGSGLLSHGGRPRAQASVTARPQTTHTATTAPTPTLSPTPSGTATPSQQQILDQEAYNSFRSVTLATFVDGSCSPGNSRSHFAVGQHVYINLCTSAYPANGPMTIRALQGGYVVATLVYGQYLAAGGSYWYYHGLPAGSYDMVVTITLDGYPAVARDLYFTVG